LPYLRKYPFRTQFSSFPSWTTQQTVPFEEFKNAILEEFGTISSLYDDQCVVKKTLTLLRDLMVERGVAPWILFATIGGIMDGKCIYCSDRSAGTPTLTVSWTPLPSFYWFFMCSISFSCCQYIVLDVIPFVVITGQLVCKLQ
jgi:hypothetical protein